MTPDNEPLHEGLKKLKEFLSRPKPNMTAWRAALKKTAATEQEKIDAAAARVAAEEVAKDNVGYLMPDGTIYAGISPETKKPMYAAPVDAPIQMDFKAASQYAQTLKIGVKGRFRVPTKDELTVLFQNREKGALAGTFNLSNHPTRSCYWSSSPRNSYAGYFQQFGHSQLQSFIIKEHIMSVRCIR